MTSYNYDTMNSLDWTKIGAIGLVLTPSAYFFNLWVNGQPPSTFVSIACVIFSIVSLLASFHLIVFTVFVLLSPLFALTLLYRLTIALPYLCTGFGPWCLSLLCAQRPPLYASRLEMPQGKECRLCGRCSNIVDQSSILRGTRWRLTRSKEEYDFYTKDQLQQSSKDCHLCSLLWYSSFDAQTTLVPGTSSGESMGREPNVTTPLLSAVSRTCNSHDCEQGDAAVHFSVQISATRNFGCGQLLHIRLYEKGSSLFPWRLIEDTSYGTSRGGYVPCP